MKHNVIESLRGRLIVSCQAYPGEPMRDPRTMTQMALSAARGGAAAIRAQGLDDLRLIHRQVELPAIGLWKDGDALVYITPTLEHALAVAETGVEIVAIDGTAQNRPDGRTVAETIAELHRRTDVLVMADCSTLEEGRSAADAGADLVGTTLAGYTPYTNKTAGPDLRLVEQLAAAVDVPVICEGRVHTPDQARGAIEAGAFSVVVGTAITHPTTITGWFADAVGSAQHG
ncbi:putative N-acetylmannosamine-6-phosphate 2-epimerase [Flexivirga endophytica]|uniref:Putative N-acetylmannosamine-6-phosphate 2-epimerase n=1 Tax=Flexivirga endophytica TaxID=1849103 RepID=A0A916TJD6_9MICO|nr:N-acetylmannosamine-6-phosphate 2-epimerase [Flexivirga endophytica]GGB44303.1 putative N-acetylmannosamine-6-phosphate 2-epimerase [Flexivirga endophytica]GHB60211.1 putative N-acetylmannosamine-6-phosphate 2-epimerase [Flexivirga endophytica]